MALGDSVGKQAADEITSIAIPEMQKALEPFVNLLPFLEALLAGKKKLVVTLEDV